MREIARIQAMQEAASALAELSRAQALARRSAELAKLGHAEAATGEDLRAHYAIYSQSVRNLGTPVFPAKLFRAMFEAFPQESDILTVFKDGEPISSVLNFYHDGAVMPYWGGGTWDARRLRGHGQVVEVQK